MRKMFGLGSLVLIAAAMTASWSVYAEDFATRCAGAGVVRCVSFDSAADLNGTYGDAFGILTGDVSPEIDVVVKASGAGSLKFIIPTNSGSGSSGSYFTNFSDDLSVQFDGGDEFYIQWRQMFSPEFLSTRYQGGGGWKQAIIGTGDQPGQLYASCTALTIVTQNTNQRGFTQLYNSCTGSASHGPYAGFEEPVGPGPSDYKLQNARPDPFCLYSQGFDSPPSFFPPEGNCFGYFPNEWMTFQIAVTLGPREGDEFKNSNVKMWVAREGEASELVFDWGPYNLTAGQPEDNEEFGKIWLLPYHTGKDSSQVHPEGYTWYDDLIISRSRVPDPDASDTLRPTSPSGLGAQ